RQAEDCIRYKLVTGVQTCALPIFTPAAVKDCIGRTFRSAMEFTDRSMLARRGPIWDCATVSRSRNWLWIKRMPTDFSWPWPGIQIGRASCRKECGWLWSAQHYERY